ncbi:MAG: hypothetical protein EB059_11250, partial [Alphaproteobacteria bacterium]|nr:hypothetical protein [Alphaproteobacteria bacterium]
MRTIYTAFMKKATMLFALAVLLMVSVTRAQAPVSFAEAKITVGRHELRVQLAQTPQQCERGLMSRDSLTPWDGMVFIFDNPQPVAFWMKDTKIPLEVGFFDDGGVLQEIYALKPLDLTPIRSKADNIKYALELPAGGFVGRGLRIG